MATIAELRDAYPDFLKDKSDTDIVRMLAEKDGLSLPYVAYELGLDPAEWQQNEGFWEDTGSDVAMGVSDIPGVAAGIVDLVNPLAWAGTDYTLSKGWDAVEDATGLADWRARQGVTLSPERLAQEQAVAEAFKNEGLGAAAWEALTSPRAFVGAAARSLPAALASGFGLGMPLRAAATARGMDRLAKVAPWLAEGAHAGGAGVDQATEAGVDPAMANLVGLGTGVTTGALGGTIGATARRFGIDDVQAVMAGAGRTAEVTRPLYQRIPMTAGVEMAQEVPQSGTEQMWQNYAQGKPLMEDVAHQAVMGGLAGGVMGAGFGLFPRGRKIDSNTPTDLLQDDPTKGLDTTRFNLPSDVPSIRNQVGLNTAEGLSNWAGVRGPGDTSGYTSDLTASYNEPSGHRVADKTTGIERELSMGDWLYYQATGQLPTTTDPVKVESKPKLPENVTPEMQRLLDVARSLPMAADPKNPKQGEYSANGHNAKGRPTKDAIKWATTLSGLKTVDEVNKETEKGKTGKAGYWQWVLPMALARIQEIQAEQAQQSAANTGQPNPGTSAEADAETGTNPDVKGGTAATTSITPPEGVSATPEAGPPPVIPAEVPPTDALSGQTTPQASQAPRPAEAAAPSPSPVPGVDPNANPSQIQGNQETVPVPGAAAPSVQVQGSGNRELPAQQGGQTADADQTQTKPTLNFSRSGQGQPAPGFFSQLKRVVERAKQTTMPGGQWKAWLKANQAQLGVKQEEIEATGIDEYLDARGKDKVTREEIAAFVENNGVRVEEVVKGSDTAKFDKWQLPGGSNYKELLLTLPTKKVPADGWTVKQHSSGMWAVYAPQGYRLDDLYQSREEALTKVPEGTAGQYQSGHYSEPNILAHVRINERTDTDGKRVLFVEEIQSDWGQQGRNKGFKSPSRTWAEIDKELSEVSRKRSALIDEAASLPDSEMAKFRRLTGEADELGKRLLELRAEQDAIETNRDRVPTGPFVTNTKSWTALALKRLMTYAVENGFDRVAWTTGEQQAERYNLSKQISDIAWRGGDFRAWDKQGNEVVRQTGTTQQDVADYVGKEVADKLFSQTPQGEGRNALYQLSGEDLNVGGQGMKAFYGSIVPQVANDLLKKLGGGRVGSVAVNISKGKKTTASQQFGFDITPAMRAKVQGGLPLFARKPNKAKQTSGNTVADVERWIAGPKAKLAQWVTNGLNVVQSVDELRARYPGMDIPDDVVGMHEGGYVFLVADNITNANQARKALAHEVVGHLGLERMLGKKGFERIVRQIDSYIRAQNPAVLKALGRVKAKYTDDQGKYNLNKVQEASEILADLAELNPNFGLVREIIARIRMWFAKHGLGNYAAAELNQLLVEAARFTETGFTSFAEGNFRVAPAYMLRTKPAPTQTVKAYKLFRVDPRYPGQLFPLFVNAKESVPIGEWHDADIGEQNASGKVKSKIGPLAYRPGWHAGDIPVASHIGGKSDPALKAPDYRPENQVWAEVEMAADVDWQTEADRRGTNAKGKVVPVKAHITDQIPEDGFYRYKTNSNMTGQWLIGGSMRVTRVLTDAEVARINKEAGYADLPRQQPLDLTKYGFTKDGLPANANAAQPLPETITIDGANPNINFMRGPTKQDASNLWDWIKTETEAGVEAFSRKVGLGALTNEQMADRWGKEFAPLKTIANVLDATEAKAAQWEKKAEDADRDWAALTAEQDQLMSEIMGDASLHGYDPDTGQLPVGHISKEQRARVMAAKVILDARWQRLKTLDANGKHKAVAVYRQVRDYHQQRLQEAINYVRAQLQQKGTVRPDDPLLKSLEALEAMGKRPYFPLMRLGDYYVVGMSPQMADLEKRFRAKQLQPGEDALREKLRRDPKHYWVEGTARLATAKRLAEKLRKEMGFAQYNAERYKLANARSHVGQDVGKFEQALEGMALDTKTHDALVEMYEQLLISALPEHHNLKRTLHREGIYGWDKNMRAVFAKTAQTGAWALSRMMHVSDLQQAMSELDEMSKTGEPNAQDARALHNELLARQDLTFTRYEDPLLVRGAMKFSYLSMLGFSPAFWAINLTQPWMVTLPYLTARNGNEFKATSSALWRGVREAFSMIESSFEGKELRTQFNPDKVNKQGQKVRLTADERRMLDAFGADGTLDFTIGYDLGAIAKGGSGKWQKVMRTINAPTHATELANRVGTALAAYRISRQSQHSHEQALEFAKKAVNTTQVNYNPANKARYMQAWAGNRWLPKLAFQFYTYQQAMAYLALSTLRDAIKGDKVAQSTMAWMTGMLGATGGVFALPFAQMTLGAASLIFSALGGGDDEEDVDFQRDLRNLFSDHLPEPVARLLNKGLGSMLLQTDLGARIGMGNLMNPLAFARFEAADKGADTVQEVLFRAGGAPVANVANAVDGLSAMRDVMGALVTGDAPKGSDVTDALSKLFPLKGVRDIFRGIELSAEGVTTGEGEPRLTDFSYLEVALQSAGITPLRKTMYYERNAAIQGAKEAMKIARGDLIREYAQARLAGEPIGPILAKIGAFNRRNPQNRIDQDTLKRSTTQRQKDRQSLDNGILKSKENRPYLAAGRWAE